MKEPIIINGFKVIKDYGYINGSKRGLVICKVCERQYETDPNKLKYRKHCGCIKHGRRVCAYAKRYPRLMEIYKHMMSRCYNKNNKDYYNYGKKGVYVCDQWKGNPDAFCKWALENGYQDTLTIDRIDSKKSYFPENCRWADAKTQSRNTSRNVLTMELANEMRRDKSTMTYNELAKKYKVSYGTVSAVINFRVWRE